MSPAASDDRGDSVAFLLAQLGHHSASVFADLMASIELPRHMRILRAIVANPGQPAGTLLDSWACYPAGSLPTWTNFEDRGYVERRRNPDDRRLHALYVTASGKKVMSKIGDLARQQDRLITAGLDTRQRATLHELLAEVAERQGLTPHVHPGFRTLGRGTSARDAK